MASKAFSFSSYSLIFLVIALICNTALAARPKNNKKSSAFDFVKHLQGCHKGETVKGLHDLKKYLHRFGYLTYQNKSLAKTDDFDDQLEAAIKTYQLNHHLNCTGTLDSETVSKMMKPRCGVADIINGHTRMESGNKSHGHHNSTSKFHTVSHYTFIDANRKWPENKYHLKYGFLPRTPTAAMEPVRRAFGTWQANTHFSFERVENLGTADLSVGFGRRNHGDGYDFDGPGGTIAHAFAPQDGRFHYDGDEQWTVGAVQGALDYETVALHEIGHLLGLGHSSIEGAIMYDYIDSGVTKGLHADDIEGIKALYNR